MERNTLEENTVLHTSSFPLIFGQSSLEKETGKLQKKFLNLLSGKANASNKLQLQILQTIVNDRTTLV